MKRRTALVVFAGIVGLAGPAAADETTFCNFFITTLPYTISTQGHYCFNKNLATAILTGNAITINADFVVLDLNNFKLGGGSAGLTTDANGIAATSHNNITIRNGNIRGFRNGILVTGGTNLVIENNALDGNTDNGMFTNTGQTVVRNNIVSNTGGSTLDANATGIYAWGANVSDNVVDNVYSATGSVTGIDTYFAALIDHNLIKLGSAAVARVGTKWGLNRDNTVQNQTTAFQYSYALIGHNYP